MKIYSNKYIIFLILTCIPNIISTTPMKRLKKLQIENENFINNPVFKKQRKTLIEKQNPKYIILSCSDSRATPEYIFNQSLGEMFTVRVAGQVVDKVVIDTIEFAVKTFDVVNLIVMGHQNCGAVDGALNRLKENDGKVKIPKKGRRDYIDAILMPIEKAIVEANVDINASDALEKATIANVNYITAQLKKKSAVIAQAIKSKKIILIGAVYSLETGKVEFIG